MLSLLAYKMSRSRNILPSCVSSFLPHLCARRGRQCAQRAHQFCFPLSCLSASFLVPSHSLYASPLAPHPAFPLHENANFSAGNTVFSCLCHFYTAKTDPAVTGCSTWRLKQCIFKTDWDSLVFPSFIWLLQFTLRFWFHWSRGGMYTSLPI